MYGKSIESFLVNETEDGFTAVELSNWNGMAFFKIPII